MSAFARAELGFERPVNVPVARLQRERGALARTQGQEIDRKMARNEYFGASLN